MKSFCTRCGSVLSPDTAFCTSCGAAAQSSTDAARKNRKCSYSAFGWDI
jgi:uncharacterized OB-fold protein